VDLTPSGADETFRKEVRDYFEAALSGEFSVLRDRGGPGDQDALVEERIAWERRLGADGWTCVAWPTEHGGRGLSMGEQIIYYEEYARAGGPGRAGIVGEGLLGPTLIHFGSTEQQERFLPGIVAGTEFWCQGYSEPDAGSDLAGLKTRADLDGDEWVINGQKVWTSLAQWSEWCFVLCRTDQDAPKHKGISYLLCSMDTPGIEVRGIRQVTGTAEFNEVFFNDVRVPKANVVGEVNDGWKVAMGTLAFERGESTLGQQLVFMREFDQIRAAAKANGRIDHPVFRQRLIDIWGRLQILRWNTLRVLSIDAASHELAGPAMVTKLYWASLHREMGELAVDVRGADAMVGAGVPYELRPEQKLFFFTRSDTIYGGSNQIQRNIIGERALGLPREPRVAAN
jgi:alkylation response protein AidB-like acyl-CoA dehydrogenase